MTVPEGWLVSWTGFPRESTTRTKKFETNALASSVSDFTTSVRGRFSVSKTYSMPDRLSAVSVNVNSPRPPFAPKTVIMAFCQLDPLFHRILAALAGGWVRAACRKMVLPQVRPATSIRRMVSD